MVVHDAEPTDRYGKDLIKLFEPLIDPIFSIVDSIVLEEPCGAYASRNTVIPTGYVRVHKSKSSRSHRFVSHKTEPTFFRGTKILPQNERASNKKMPVLSSAVLEKPRGTNASRNTVIPTSHVRVQKSKSNRCHGLASHKTEPIFSRTTKILRRNE